jgi:hypothetical protein
MAGKSPRKPGKSKSATKATAQPSTVTPITQAGASSANQAGAPVGAHSNTGSATQSDKPVAAHSNAPVTTHPGAAVTMMEEVRTTVVKLADQEIIEQVRVRAYEFFEQRGRQEGNDREDWARAEAEILAKYQREKSA